MGKKKNESGSWMDALHGLIRIIEAEYGAGGKLPPVPEMARKLHVAENTYCKALRSICRHGLAHASQGRAGTIILPEKNRRLKIGLLSQEESPILPSLPLSFLLPEILKKGYLLQMLCNTSPDQLREQLLILNIRALFAVNPPPAFYPVLAECHQRGFPVVIVEYYNYGIIEQANKFHLPYFHTDPNSLAASVFAFAEKVHANRLLQVDLKPTILTTAFAQTAAASGQVFDENHFCPFSRIENGLAARIKKQKIDIIYAKCNEVHAESICRQTAGLPEQLRPLLLFSKEVKSYFQMNPEGCHGCCIAGYFDFDSPTYQLAVQKLLDAISGKHAVSMEQNHEFTILPTREIRSRITSWGIQPPHNPQPSRKG